ncbi:MAG: hypothetical protein IJ092_08495 [Atopobiaceae bacterium]|nr:hypothetical protein [Atopobiaceae bacterium]
MDMDDEELARELGGLLLGSGYKTAFGDESESADSSTSEEEAQDDFFTALSAFRAARASGDKQAEAAAEDHLREVVRAELTGE